MANLPTNPTIGQLAADLAAGRTTSRKLTEEAFARIEDRNGEGKRVFVKTWRAQALAAEDAPVVARLRAAGAVIVGSTNMSEFAFSGVGFNPHYGTPGNPADRRRVPGGSSSGAAVSVADRMAVAALGTDTGGSVRIPAAVCGIVGFQPTAARGAVAGALPPSAPPHSF